MAATSDLCQPGRLPSHLPPIAHLTAPSFVPIPDHAKVFCAAFPETAAVCKKIYDLLCQRNKDLLRAIMVGPAATAARSRLSDA